MRYLLFLRSCGINKSSFLSLKDRFQVVPVHSCAAAVPMFRRLLWLDGPAAAAAPNGAACLPAAGGPCAGSGGAIRVLLLPLRSRDFLSNIPPWAAALS